MYYIYSSTLYLLYMLNKIKEYSLKFLVAIYKHKYKKYTSKRKILAV